jgi:hypothetical protein
MFLVLLMLLALLEYLRLSGRCRRKAQSQEDDVMQLIEAVGFKVSSRAGGMLLSMLHRSVGFGRCETHKQLCFSVLQLHHLRRGTHPYTQWVNLYNFLVHKVTPCVHNGCGRLLTPLLSLANIVFKFSP